MDKQGINRIGEVNKNRFGTEMVLVEYTKHIDIVVEFQDKFKLRKKTRYSHFKEGNVRNPYDKEVFGVAYIGEGKYSSRENGKKTKAYTTWVNMIRRCYDPYTINKSRGMSYKDVTVCKEWHNFQNFAEWFENNYYEIPGEKICLDKDILVKGNKVYSPDTCIFAPESINGMFVYNKPQNKREPIGVHKEKYYGTYKVNYAVPGSKNGERKYKYVGSFRNVNDAFASYKKAKEDEIKRIADKYKEYIPEKLYNALYLYEIQLYS